MNLKHFLGFVFLIALAACGGDGGGTNPPPNTPGSISGTLLFPGSLGGLGLETFTVTKTGSATVTPKPKSASIVPGDLIVQFRPGIRTQALDTLSVAGQRLRLERSVSLPSSAQFQLYKTSGLNEAETLQLAATLRERSDVLSVTTNAIYQAHKTPNDALYPLQWHYPAMNMPNAWDINDGTNASVTVAVLDSGIVNHPDLQGVLLPGYDFVSDPSNAGDNDGRDADPTDLGGRAQYHGSHVAGTVAAASNNGSGVAGVSWGAKIVPVRVLGTQGGNSFDIIEATLWAAGFQVNGVPANPHPAKVLNLSLGGSRPCEAFEEQVYRDLKNAGVIIVVAAGNDNSDAGLYSPASCDHVITVGATGPTNERAYYSNYGSKIDIMAPGGDFNYTLNAGGQTYPGAVLSTVYSNDTQTFDFSFQQGTSMASPHIAGLVALMLAQDPSLTYDSILQRLQASATPLSAQTCQRPSASDCGPGLVDAAQALSAGGAPGPGNPNPGNPGNPGAPPPPPPTGNLTTYVVGFYCTAPNCGLPNTLLFDEARSGITQLQPTGSEAAYSLPGLSSGSYVVAGWQDLNGDQIVDDNEPFGVYNENGNFIVLLSEGGRVQNITIRLEAYTAGQGVTGETSEAATRQKELRQAVQRLLEHPN